MKKLLLLILLIPCSVVASDELGIFRELVPWLSDSDSIKLNEVKLISPKQNDAKKAILLSDKYIVNINDGDIGVLKGK